MNNKYSKKPNRVLRGAWGSVIHKSKAKLFDDDGTVDTTTDVTNDHASSEHASFMKPADNSWLVGAGQLWRGVSRVDGTITTASKTAKNELQRSEA